MRISDLFSLLAPPLCWACGRAARAGAPLCAACWRALRWLPSEPVEIVGLTLWAPLAYEGPARAMVHGLKFQRAAGLADAMAAQIVASAPRALLRPPASLVPVPVHPARGRRRGFNQAERLAAAISRRTGLACLDCLTRRGPPSRQVGRGRAERLAGIGGTVELDSGPGRPRAPAQALLVDDVATTGATLAACATALHRAGTPRVAAIVYARTLGR